MQDALEHWVIDPADLPNEYPQWAFVLSNGSVARYFAEQEAVSGDVVHVEIVSPKGHHKMGDWLTVNVPYSEERIERCPTCGRPIHKT